MKQAAPPKALRIATYVRVSTKGQGEDDQYGLPRQHADIAAYVARQGHEIVAAFEDVGYSGATADRPGLAALLEAGGFDAVVVPAWDRLARDTMLDGYLRYTLEKRGVRVLSATQENGVDEISKLTQTILAGVAQYERHLIAQRLAGGRKAKAAVGGYAHGQPPYGTKATRGSKRLTIDQAEYEILGVMRALKSQGKTVRAIAEELNESGHRARNGGLWGPSSVYGALASRDRVVEVAIQTGVYEKPTQTSIA